MTDCASGLVAYRDPQCFILRSANHFFRPATRRFDPHTVHIPGSDAMRAKTVFFCTLEIVAELVFFRVNELNRDEIDAIFGMDGQLKLSVIYVLLALLCVFCLAHLIVHLVNDGTDVGLIVLGFA